MSPPSAAQSQEARGVKRKKPPTFQHLPLERAKKLKQSWVETQKIKSKWKAQKRREGLTVARPHMESVLGSDATITRPQHDKTSANEDLSQRTDGDPDESGEGSGSDGSEDETSDENNAPPPRGPESKSKTRPQKGEGLRQISWPSAPSKTTDKSDERQSLRDLQRKAYSRSSLHTHKSHTLGRHNNDDKRGRGGRLGRGGRGRGRGQPDMGLRMKAMLGKIKQDYA